MEVVPGPLDFSVTMKSARSNGESFKLSSRPNELCSSSAFHVVTPKRINEGKKELPQPFFFIIIIF
jgi:hypothetical protein